MRRRRKNELQKKAEAERKRTLESVVGVMSGLETRLKSVERFMQDVRDSADKTFVEIQRVAKTEDKVVRLAETLSAGNFSTEVAEAKKAMVEAAGVLGDAARRVERKEGDESEESGAQSLAQVVRRRKPRGPKGILEVPEETGRSQVTREQVIKCLNPKKGEVKIRGLRRQGKEFVIEVHGGEDLQKLRSNVALGQVGVKVDGVAKLKWLRALIHDEDRGIEKEGLLEAVLVRNKDLLGMADEILGSLESPCGDPGSDHDGGTCPS